MQSRLYRRLRYHTICGAGGVVTWRLIYITGSQDLRSGSVSPRYPSSLLAKQTRLPTYKERCPHRDLICQRTEFPQHFMCNIYTPYIPPDLAHGCANAQRESIENDIFD